MKWKWFEKINQNLIGRKIMEARILQSIVGFVILFLFANHAWANWINYEETNELGKMYYDKSTINKMSKTIIRVRTKIVLNENGKKYNYSFLEGVNEAPNNPDILSYDLTLQDIDCNSEKVKPISSTIHDKNNNIVYAFPKDIKWHDISADSYIETLKNIVCGGSKTSKIGKVFAGKKEMQARIAFLPYLEKYIHEYFQRDPIITLAGKNKTILILESVRLDKMTTLVMKERMCKALTEKGFEKVFFIRQKYNAKEVDGDILDVEPDGCRWD